MIKALNAWEAEHGIAPSESEEILLIMCQPLLKSIDPTVLGTLTKCVKLSLACNAIEKMRPMPPLRNLKILALSRNKLSRIQHLEEIGDTLEELWLSYNNISTLSGLHQCRALTCLHIGQNNISKPTELDKLRDNPKLTNVLFMGNPIYEGKADVEKDQPEPALCEAQLFVLKRLPQLEKIDGKNVLETDRAKMNDM